VQVEAYRDGRAYASAARAAFAAGEARAPQAAYAANFDEANTDFLGGGIGQGREAGFATGIAATAHPYGDARTITYQLRTPIVIGMEGTHLRYDDDAIIEPGEPGTVFGDAE